MLKNIYDFIHKLTERLVIDIFWKARVNDDKMRNIPGYLMRREALFLNLIAGRVRDSSVVVEVGSYKGKSTAYMCSALSKKNNIKFYAVDTFCSDSMPVERKDVLDEFLENTKEYKSIISPLRGIAHETAKKWSLPIDLLFIDGDHSYEAVRTDIEDWVKFVKSGGIVIFHDYGNPCGVKEAVDRYFRKTQKCAILVQSVYAAIKR
jgi:predicted O-methyltransferase YrrM